MSYGAYKPISEEITLTREGPSATVVVFAPWDDAITYGLAAIGGYRTVFGTLQYFTPDRYERDGLRLYCNSCKIVNAGDYGSNDWQTAKLTLAFGILDQPEDNSEGQDPTQVADWTFQLSGEELVLPKTGLHLDSSTGDPPGDDVPNPIKVVPKGSLTAHFPRKPRQDAANWKTYVGKTNDGALQGFAAETLLFMGLETKRTQTSDGSDAWEFSLMFEIQYEGWNKVYDPSAAAWRELHPAQYETADFNALIAGI